MNSSQQMPQVPSLASQPQQVTNEPRQIQHSSTTQSQRRRQVMTVSQHVQGMQGISSGSPPGPEDLQTMPHQAPDVPPMPLQSLRPMPDPRQTRHIICVLQHKPQVVCKLQQKPQMSPQQDQQTKTEQLCMQQAKAMRHVVIVSKKTHVSNGRPTPSTLMPAPQQALEKTHVPKQVSETKQTQVSANSTLQQKQVRTQQDKKQQDMAVLLQEQGMPPSKLVTFVTSLPTPQQVSHVFIAPEQALQSTPVTQKAQDEMNVAQRKSQMKPQSQLNLQVTTTSSQTTVPQNPREELIAFLNKLEFSFVLDLLSVLPMMVPMPKYQGFSGGKASRSDSVQERIGGIQNQPVYDRNLHKLNNGEIQENQEEPPEEELSDFHRNLIFGLLEGEIIEGMEKYCDPDYKSTLLLADDILVALHDLEQCDLETSEFDCIEICGSKIKENNYVKRLRNTNSVSGLNKPSHIIPLTGTYCRIRHILLQSRHQNSPKQQTGPSYVPPAQNTCSCIPVEGMAMYFAPIFTRLPAQGFLQRISVKRHLEDATTTFGPHKTFCSLHSSSQEQLPQAKFSGSEITITPVLEIVKQLSQQANTKALKAHLYVFSALLQQLHRTNQVTSVYFKNIIAECLRNSEIQIADQPVAVTSSQAQTDKENEINGAQAGGECNIATPEVPLNVISTDELSSFQEELLQNSSVGLDNNQSYEQKCDNHEFPKGKPVSPHIPRTGTILEAVVRFCMASPRNCLGFTDRFHIQLLLKAAKAVLNGSGSLNIKNNSGTSVHTVSQTQQKHHTQWKKSKVGIPCSENLKQKVEDQQKNLRATCLIGETHPLVTRGSENNNDLILSPTVSNSRSMPSLSMPTTIPKQSKQDDMQKTMSMDKRQECDGLSVKCSYLASGNMTKERGLTVQELCNILCAGEDAIIACAGCDTNSMKEQNQKMTQASKTATGSKPNGSSETSSSQHSHTLLKPGELYLLMPSNDRFYMICGLLIQSADETKVVAKYYEAGKNGFIEYVRTSEAPQYDSKSQTATEHSKTHSIESNRRMTSTMITNNTAPCCNCKACTDSTDGRPVPAVSSAAMVIDSLEILMEALTLGDTLDAKHCKKEDEVLQECKGTGTDDSEKDNSKKAPQRKPRRRRH